jgi:hypothetical protein
MKISSARHAALAIAAATLMTACSTASYPTREAARRNAPTQVVVRNHNWMDMNVYAIRNSQRVRIGQVTSNATARLSIPRGMDLSSGAIQLEADPIGSNESFVSQPIALEQGTVLNWTIENHIQLSSYYITSR